MKKLMLLTPALLAVMLAGCSWLTEGSGRPAHPSNWWDGGGFENDKVATIVDPQQEMDYSAQGSRGYVAPRKYMVTHEDERKYDRLNEKINQRINKLQDTTTTTTATTAPTAQTTTTDTQPILQFGSGVTTGITNGSSTSSTQVTPVVPGGN